MTALVRKHSTSPEPGIEHSIH